MVGYSGKIVATIWNGLVSNTIVFFVRIVIVEVSQTQIQDALVGFDHDLSILTGASTSDIDLHTDDFIYHLNETSLIQIYANYLLSMSQDQYFGISVYYVAYH